MRLPALFPVALVVTLLAACSGPAPRPVTSTGTISQAPLAVSEQGNEVALYALGLIDTGYRFGGKNPDAGLDCSGMVSYIYGQAAGLKVQGSAADIARNGRVIDRQSNGTCCGRVIWSFLIPSSGRFPMSGSISATSALFMRLPAMAACASTG